MKTTETTVTDREAAPRWGITGSTLKIIGIVSMVIDHTGAIILERAMSSLWIPEAAGSQAYTDFFPAGEWLYETYYLFRAIGRMAFPIFCFLAVQGFLHTGNVKKYLGRLFLFALISEIPFDLAFFGGPVDFGYQNVFFTLFFGVLALSGLRFAEEKQEWHPAAKGLFSLFAVGLSMGAALLLKTDYDMLGVLTIVVFYLFRERRLLSAALGCTVLMEIPAFVCLLPIHWYNDQPGKNLKWIFYAFYPAHILILYLIALALGLA